MKQLFNPWTQYCKAVWDVFTSITNTAKIRSVLPFNTENCSCFHIIICFWTAVTYSDHVSLSISQDWAAFVFGNFWHQFHVVFCCYSLVSHEIIVDESVQFASHLVMTILIWSSWNCGCGWRWSLPLAKLVIKSH